MIWEKFLKPDWKKIVIFVILFVLLSFFYLYLFTDMFLLIQPDPRHICCIKSAEAAEICEDLMARSGIVNMTPEEACSEYRKSIEEKGNTVIISLFMILVFSYLLSCLIIRTYDKTKKKK